MKLRPFLRGPIALRLFLFNCLLIFVPVAGFLSFEAYEKALLNQQERAMVQEGRAIAAWLAAEPLTAAKAGDVLVRLGKAHTSRIRIISREHVLLADSSLIDPAPPKPSDADSLYSRLKAASAPAPTGGKAPERTFVYRLLSAPVRLVRKYALPPQPPLEAADWYAASRAFNGAEIEAALAGRYGSTTRVSSGGQSSVTLYSALPVSRDASVEGVVLVSQSTWRILTDLYALRLAIGRIFLWSLLAAVLVSFLLAMTISRPLSRLRREAAETARRGRAGRAFTGSGRGDEVDALAASFTALVRRLDERIDWAVRFSADASHELRNPLAGIRANAELLETGDPAHDRPALAIQAACARMEQSLAGLRSLSLLERPAPESPGTPITEALSGLASRYPGIVLDSSSVPGEVLVSCPPEQLDCAVANLIENALSFSIGENTVCVAARIERSGPAPIVAIEISDRGPGIPEENMQKLFDRFFSARPGDSGKRHAGLGLALVRAIAEGAGGSVSAENREDGGAHFTLRFPTKA